MKKYAIVNISNFERNFLYEMRKITLKSGNKVIVRSKSRGLDLGVVMRVNVLLRERIIGSYSTNRYSPFKNNISNCILRLATKRDIAIHEENLQSSKEAYKIIEAKIKENGYKMDVISVEYNFDFSKIFVYYVPTVKNSVQFNFFDFLNLGAPVQLRQVNQRYEARKLKGIGLCGKLTCCSTFLKEFDKNPIKCRTSTKNVGVCGQMLCCFEYEHNKNFRNSPPDSALEEMKLINTRE